MFWIRKWNMDMFWKLDMASDPFKGRMKNDSQIKSLEGNREW